MKFSFNIKKQEATFEADVEKLVEKRWHFKANNPSAKTKYQIKQEEKRKNEELKHKLELQKDAFYIGMMLIIPLLVMLISFIFE